ncbi:MAG: hypothetical protein ACLQME_04590, partial [Alphaproteobacteria bacterium]
RRRQEDCGQPADEPESDDEPGHEEQICHRRSLPYRAPLPWRIQPFRADGDRRAASFKAQVAIRVSEAEPFSLCRLPAILPL